MSSLPIYKKTRIAPTPSGFLHIGNACSFLLTQALAIATGAGILLRIDDLDAQRSRPEYIQDIFETLDFLEIQIDEGPRDASDFERVYGQVHRMALYENALRVLREKDLLYACDCSRAALTKAACHCREKGLSLEQSGLAWRIVTDHQTPVAMKDKNGHYSMYRLPENMLDFVVRKKDGLPAYQLASVVDDCCYGIDLVVRGKDLHAISLAQLQLAEKLGLEQFKQTAFYHHELVVDEQGRKLSKSAGAVSLRAFRARGKGLAELREMLAIDRFGFSG